MGLKRLERPSAEDIINRGADVTADKMDNKKEWCNFTLRIRKDLLTQIGDQLEERVGISKTAWILEAIQEKLKGK